MLYALLFLPALCAIAYIALRPRRQAVVLAEAVVEPVSISGDPDPFTTLESLLGELERLTLDERDVEELERLAAELERTARELERVG